MKWLQKLNDLLCRVRDGVGFGFGIASICFWLFAQLPQFVLNIKNQSVEALSSWFLAQWLLVISWHFSAWMCRLFARKPQQQEWWASLTPEGAHICRTFCAVQHNINARSRLTMMIMRGAGRHVQPFRMSLDKQPAADADVHRNVFYPSRHVSLLMLHCMPNGQSCEAHPRRMESAVC